RTSWCSSLPGGFTALRQSLNHRRASSPGTSSTSSMDGAARATADELVLVPPGRFRGTSSVWIKPPLSQRPGNVEHQLGGRGRLNHRGRAGARPLPGSGALVFGAVVGQLLHYQ